jgi:thiamine-phosphate pyrophosphorylase
LDLGYVEPYAALETASELLKGGVGILQLRAKGHEPSSLLPLATELSALCRSASVPFIVNDHVTLAKDCGADGLHVGQEDLSVAEARKILGPSAIIGKSTHSVAQAIAAAAEHPDYIGFGPLFATATKPDYRPIGIEQIEDVHQAVQIPIFCIGGIHLKNLSLVVLAGARRVVIVSALLQAIDIPSYCEQCLAILPSEP